MKTLLRISALALALSFSGNKVGAVNSSSEQSAPIEAHKVGNVFSVKNPDFQKSPYSGMTRRHWIEAGEFLLNGAFGYIHCLDDPMYFPKQLDKTYPENMDHAKTAKLEGLARTMFVAAPLLKNNPNLTLNGIKVAEYYRYQLAALTNPDSKHFVPRRTGGASQTLLELASLCISMKAAPEALWQPLTKQEKDALAALILSYGEGPSIDSNWMFFNVFAMSFFKDQGYKVDEKKMVDYLQKLLSRYRGEGWYNDAPAYDYYSMWAYQSYGPLWVEFFGKHFKPAQGSGLDADIYQKISAQYLKNEQDLVANYPYMFARDGRMNMWGRSICYRFAAVTPLPILEYGNFEGVNYGWLRHIASASLLQFMTHPDFLENGIPTMGFYGPFDPCVQIYSCRGSVFWIGKAFLGLLLPETSKYWSAVENEGPWKDELKVGNVYNKFQPATGLLITNYPNCGGSEMRSWCHETVASDWQKFRSSENYNKLAYHTEFPWMADGKKGEISMNYGTKNKKGEWEVLRLYDFQNFDNEIYCRKAVLETDKEVKYQLNDIMLPDGILRVDKVSLPDTTDICLGHYTLAQLNQTALQHGVEGHPGFTERTVQVDKKTLVTVYGNGQYELAMIPLMGWTDETKVIYPRNLHPVSKTCLLPMLNERMKGERILVTLQLWKKVVDGQGFTAKELSPVKNIALGKDGQTVTVKMASGEQKTVKFE